MGKVYTSPVGNNFLEEVVNKIFADTTPIHKITVYVATRCMGKALQTQILRHSDGVPTLMPKIKTIGDMEEIFVFENYSEIKEPVNASYRRFWLADIIGKFYKSQDKDFSLTMRLGASDALVKFFDNVAMFSVDFTELNFFFADRDFAKHWGVSMEFLEKIYPEWKQHLEELGVSDIGEFNNQTLTYLNTYLQQTNDRVYLIGLTGVYPVVRGIIKTVSDNENGVVILPSYDVDLIDKQKENISSDITHPMYTLQQSVDMLEVKIEVLEPQQNDRKKLFSSVFLPASDTVDWLSNTPPANGFNGIDFLTADSHMIEALSIALMMRHNLEETEKTTALITPDRNLSRMVIATLKRWNIEVDDSSGILLQFSPTVVFIRLVSEAISENFSAKSLAGLLKHPLCNCGMDRGKFIRLVHAFEIFTLRDFVGISGLELFKKHIKIKESNPYNVHSPYIDKCDEFINLIDDLQEKFSPAFNEFSSLQDMIETYIKICESLAGEDAMWNGTDGNEVARAISELLSNTPIVNAITASDFSYSFTSLLQGKTIRKSIGLHPRLYIWGPLEARLQSVDNAIISGMNEGVMPANVSVDAWVSRQMAQEIGLPSPDVAVGISANDMISACNGTKITFTRSKKDNGKETIASRWWQRFQAVCNAVGFSDLPRNSDYYLEVARKMSDVSNSVIDSVKIDVPKPTPPFDVRPKKLSVTNIQTWYDDPYQIYAKYILGLYPTGDLSGEVSPAIRGNVFHTILERFITKYQTKVPVDAEQILQQIGDDEFTKYSEIPEVRVMWQPQFNVAIKGFLKEWRSRCENIEKVFCEKLGESVIKTKNGNEFTISGKADRIDILKDGTAIVVDYKTGTLPSKTKIQNGESPQMSLQAYIFDNGDYGIENIKSSAVEIHPVKPKYEIISSDIEIKNENIIENALNILNEQIDLYSNEETPYFKEEAFSRYNDYAHLMRRKEWGLIIEDDKEGND